MPSKFQKGRKWKKDYYEKKKDGVSEESSIETEISADEERPTTSSDSESVCLFCFGKFKIGCEKCQFIAERFIGQKCFWSRWETEETTSK